MAILKQSLPVCICSNMSSNVSSNMSSNMKRRFDGEIDGYFEAILACLYRMCSLTIECDLLL